MFKRLVHKGIPLGEIYDALGTTKDIRYLTLTVDELPLVEQLLDENPDDVIDPRPDSWAEILSSSGRICWENLYQQDVETRSEFEDESTEDDGEEKVEDESTEGDEIDAKLESFKEKVEESLKEFEESMRETEALKFKFLKQEMKKMIGGLVKSEFRKWTKDKRREGGEDLDEAEDSEEAEFREAQEDLDAPEDLEVGQPHTVAESVNRLRRERRKRRRTNN